MLLAIKPQITSALLELSLPPNTNWFIEKVKVANEGHIVRCEAVCIGNALQGGMLLVTFPLGSI